jgi:hypothetical protein
MTKNTSILSGYSKYCKLPKCCAMEFSIMGKSFAKCREKFVGQGYPEGPCQPPETHLAYEHTNPLYASSKIKFQNNFYY